MKAIIKNILIGITLLPTLAYSTSAFRKDSTESPQCLRVVGLALDENNIAIDGVEVRLYKQNDEMEQVNITTTEHHYHNFIFTLDANEYYTVEISKPGFVKRSVVFYTDLPSDINIKSLFKYEFEVVLFKEKKIDDYYLDFPIALIRYNKKNKNFEDNTDYTMYIKSKIKEAEAEAEAKKINIKESKNITVKD